MGLQTANHVIVHKLMRPRSLCDYAISHRLVAEFAFWYSFHDVDQYSTMQATPNVGRSKKIFDLNPEQCMLNGTLAGIGPQPPDDEA